MQAQARERFGYLMPGETSYVVLDENGQPLESEARRSTTPTRWSRSSRRPGGPPPGRRWSWPACRPVEKGGPASRRPPRSTAPRSELGRIDPVDADGGRAAAGSRAARHPRDRAPLRVRAARRGHHRAAAAERHAVPDDVLPDLPAGRVADRHPRGVRADEGDAGPARPTTPSWRRRTGAAHERYLGPRELGRASGLDVPEIEGISAGGMPDRVKCLHVLAGQSLAQGRGREPARRRGARRCSGTGGPRARASMDRRDRG